MEQKTPKRKRYAFPYLLLGFFISFLIVGIFLALILVYQKQPVTLNNIIDLGTSNLAYIYVIIIAFYSALVWGLVGYQKERAEDTRRHSDWLAKNQKLEIQQVQDSQAQLDKKHQEEIAVLNQQIASEGTKFQDLEAVIRRGKQQWQATFDAVYDLIILTDETGNIIRCNRVTGEVFQLGYAQIIGRGINELFSNDSVNLLGMVPGDKKELKLAQAEIWYEISKNHLLVDGRQEGWVYIFRNVTPQKLAFRDQQRLTQYYELLVNNSPVAIVTHDLEDRIVDCNPAFESLFLYSRREAIGLNTDLLISPPDMMEDALSKTDTVRSGGKVQFISQRKRKDGSLVDVEVFGIPVILGGKQVGSLGLYHDVSDLVRYQKIAQAAEEQVPIEVSEPQEPIPPVEEEQQMPEIEVKSPKEVAPSRARLILVEKIEGIGPVYAQKLLEVGVKTTADLLEQGKSRKGREELVEKTGISATLVLKWVNMADMMRISGIGEEYSELLEKAGVDTVKELRNRIPEHLHQALGEANKVHKLVRRLPHLSEVEKWVKEAKEAETIMTY